MQSISIFLYSVLCLRILWKYKKNIADHFSDVDSVSLAWISILVFAYLLILGWEQTAQIAHRFDYGDFAAFAGLSKNYVDLFFINLFVVFAISKAAQPTAFVDEQDSDSLLDSSPQQPEDSPQMIAVFCEKEIEIVTKSMTQHEYFLEPDISIEKLSEKTNINIKALSKIINQHFEQNFFEFINGYRVEKAKTYLENQQESSMLDVMHLSGFNSKSTFNRLFKKQTGLTPSQYRNNLYKS